MLNICSRATFSLCIGKLDRSQMVPILKSHSLSLNLTPIFLITLKIMPEVHEKRPGKSGTVHSITMHVSYIIFIHFAKLYIQSTLNIDLILWHTQLIVCAENVKSWVISFTFQAYTLRHSLNCICVSLFKFHI